ncbi:basic amino acid ABC transporter substrate-binding protein [Janibacter cremeus]|uniref:Polar amino acid transport system substrate-binding protein n=1 Tax=Janibacter cremeus TaxID=1285192 RepID=A0A852VW58_9MICO|nr:basic amino acid ABC transporter substrate-binding protein [Janibacter cremeus]NYF98005.1 polar amino acid transport system substrate-binding protein [Janibacter cremeus]
MRSHRALALIAASALALTACGGSSDDSEGGGDDAGLGLIKSGSLTVCSDIPYPPFEFEKDGEYTGFDMDLMSEIASGLDLELAIKDVGFDGLQSGSALAAGTCDIGASAMTITEEREKNLNFSEPYYDSLQSLLVPEDSDIKSIEDLAGKTVGVQQGTTGQKYAQENIPEDAKATAYPSDAELFPALQSGGVDAVLQDLPVNLLHTQEGAFTIVEEYDTDEQYGFAVKEEGAEKLLEAVNEQLATLREDGTYDELYDKYFTEK